MPRIEVLLFSEVNGSAPIIEWLDTLTSKARIRCQAKLKLLEDHGHELRRPHVDSLGSTGQHELRVKFFRINYRMLYFFHGQGVAVVSQGFAKEAEVIFAEIKVALSRMEQFQANPNQHTYRFQ